MKRCAIAAFFDFDQTLIEVESGHMGIRMLRDHEPGVWKIAITEEDA